MTELEGKTVLVTGGNGFLGQYVLQELGSRKCAVLAPRSSECDLRDSSAIEALLARTKPHIIIHLAAVVGGIGANRLNPGKFFYENAIMGIQLMELARRSQVEKFVCLGTVCAYPKFTPVPFSEDDLWKGYPEETNAPYGLAKKMLLVQCQAYRQQYGMNAIYLIPVNLYGPRDNFDLATSHVIPALIKKFVTAAASGVEEVVLWGSGKASREFLYVTDAAAAIVKATERYAEAAPINVGSGEEITIADLAKQISRLAGYRGRITFDPAFPDGQPRRCLDTERAWEAFGFRASTTLREGLANTIDWYMSQSAATAAQT